LQSILLAVNVTYLCCCRDSVTLADTKVLLDGSCTTIALSGAIVLVTARTGDVTLLRISASTVDDSLAIGETVSRRVSCGSGLVTGQADTIAGLREVLTVETDANTGG